MKIDLEGSVVLEVMEDALELFDAILAAIGYQEEVMKIPGPTFAEIEAGGGDVNAQLANKYVHHFDANVLLFAWLVMRGFPGSPPDDDAGMTG